MVKILNFFPALSDTRYVAEDCLDLVFEFGWFVHWMLIKQDCIVAGKRNEMNIN